MAAALEVFSVIADTISIAQFIASLIPQPMVSVNTVRVIAGTGDNTDGAAPDVATFDINGYIQGITRGGQRLQKGADYDAQVKVVNPDAAVQANYVQLMAGGNDALCIAGISVMTDDQGAFGWTGDFGYYCGAPWYYSSTVIGGNNYMPKCVWIDGDASSGIMTKGLGIHLPSFAATAERASSIMMDKDLWCKTDPRFKVFDTITPLQYFDPTPQFQPDTQLDVDPASLKNPANWKINPKNADKIPLIELVSKKRMVDGNTTDTTIQTQGTGFRGKLIKSEMQSHSAMELCESSTSVGPDFVSMVEKVFCDMERKKVWRLCSSEQDVNCFDAEKNVMRGGKVNSRRDDTTGERIVRKRYHTVSTWA
ncbi:hypothetical protein BU23DRAFT_561413 [Bimuria novae-zelandiae CBS 107.79]|uniref:Uncharacterized protein n=1 Tax=Bimuria novae-zelandiae CBS 107.79 TaxID=1447943 RepID=A0A6A5UMQ6_9PLEO|nr:hypothetical protein BU23DRAFT_561413 [Bimuria novae-zelandiae CBS 107.79]